MNELNERPGIARPLQRAPIRIVAKIASGIARQACWETARTHSAEQSREWRAAAQRRLPIQRNDAPQRPMSARVWRQYRQRIARARLNAQMRPSGDTKYQNDVR